MKPRLLVLALVSATLCVAATPASAFAQGIRIRVVDSATTTPLPGALVALLDANSVVVTEALTSENGFRDLVAPAGTYRVRVRRIGYRPYVSAPVVLPRASELTVVVPRRPIVLTTIVISARSSCRRFSTDSSDALGTVWEEATKALQASRLTMEDLQGVGRGWTYRKTLGRGGVVERSDTTYFTITNRRPFGSENPATLANAGYVVGDRRSGWSYYGPDESVLLSPSFSATHCFRLVRDSTDRNLLGVSFEPVLGRRTADIAGVVWLDQRTNELRRIVFRYVNADLMSRFGGGGETHFRRLASGAWLVSAWHLRAPRIEIDLQRSARAYGFLENGGGLLAPAAMDTGAPPQSVATIAIVQPPARIEGLISRADGRGVYGADIALAGTSRSVTSDSSGRFRFANVPAGLVRVRARAVGFALADTILTVEAGRSYAVTLRLVQLIPKLETVVTSALPFGKPPRYANTGKFDDFYERRSRGRGTFFTLEDIERLDRNKVIDLLTSVPGVTVFSPGGVATIRVARCGSGERRPFEDPKWLAVFLNGQRIGGGLQMLSELNPGEIEAMEVYRGASQLPVEAMGNACAAIFVWTRYTPGLITR